MMAALFEGSVMDARAIEEAPGSCAASSLKMAYAGWTKVLRLYCSRYAHWLAHGVEQALLDEWGISQAGLKGRAIRRRSAMPLRPGDLLVRWLKYPTPCKPVGFPQGSIKALLNFTKR